MINFIFQNVCHYFLQLESVLFFAIQVIFIIYNNIQQINLAIIKLNFLFVQLKNL